MKPDHVAWRAFGSLFALLALGYGSLQVVVHLAHDEETIVREFTNIQDVTTLAVDVNDGTVHVVGRDTDTIRLTGTIQHGLVRTEHDEVLEGNRVSISTRCHHELSAFCNVDYTLEVPRDLSIIARNDNGTSTVAGITGDIDASTDNGRVEVDGGQGTLDLRSANGSVRGTDLASTSVVATTDNGSVRLTFSEPPNNVRADSDNGSVEVVLPDLSDVTYRVETDTDNGSQSSSVRTDPNSERIIIATTDNGSVTVRY